MVDRSINYAEKRLRTLVIAFSHVGDVDDSCPLYISWRSQAHTEHVLPTLKEICMICNVWSSSPQEST